MSIEKAVSKQKRVGHQISVAAKDRIEIRTTRELRGINRLLKEWTNVVRSYCEFDQFDDNPWWYNERANLSLLAAAAWRLNGWQALEEFSTTKRGVVPHAKIDSRKNVNGRCDLYVSHASTSFAVEAKQAWQSLSGRARTDNITPTMGLARLDAGNLTSDQADHRLAVVFAVPFIPLKQVCIGGRKGNRKLDHAEVRRLFDAWVVSLDLTGYDAHALVYLDRFDAFVSEKYHRVYPGVVLLVKRCKTGTRRKTAIQRRRAS